MFLLASCWHGPPPATPAARPRAETAQARVEAAPDTTDAPAREEPGDPDAAATSPSCDVYNPANPACQLVCLDPPDPAIPACRRMMPQPAPKLDRCIDAAGNNECWLPGPVFARVIGSAVVQGGQVVITIAAGTNRGIAKDWKAELCKADDRPVPGGTLTLVRVDKGVTILASSLSVDVISANPRVRLSPR